MAEPLCSVAEWKELEAHYKDAQEWHMRQLFDDDPGRFDKFRYSLLCTPNVCNMGGSAVYMYYHYSQRIIHVYTCM